MYPARGQASLTSVHRAIPIWKRVLDITCCLVALPFFAFLIFVVWALMAITSPGPIFFRQERVGYLGRRFMLFKFRTMHVGADVSTHKAHFSDLIRTNRPMQKLDAAGDSRLITGGWLIRASGLDELPQIINVLRGEMSLVGPRPCIPYEYEQYSAWQRTRFSTVPGLTGLWQVSGKNRTTFEEMVRLDIRYSQTKTLWLDLKIITLTLPALCVQIFDTQVLRRSTAQTKRASSTTTRPAPTFQT